MNRLLSIQKKLRKFPFGQQLLSYLIARNAPYFLSIRPKIITLKPYFMQASLQKRWRVQNHLQTVHAIAMCNLCEFTAGICMEASIPKKFKWIPVGMQVAYLKKAKTDLTATCGLGEINWETCEEVPCFVSVKNTQGIEVMNATIRMKVSLKDRQEQRNAYETTKDWVAQV